MKEIFRKPYIYWFFIIFLGYLFLNFLLSGFYKTIPLIIIYIKTINWLKLGMSLFLTLIIGILISVNSILIYIKYKERRKCNGLKIAGAGAVGGLIVGVCPLCVTGIFPLILSLIGISFSFASLPFGGIEIQILVFLILLISYKEISKK
ncbi:MAG: hypothetical protein AABW83_01870 [Nanoarchaeota archaeon]